MKNNNHAQGGYVGLIALLIVVAIIAFLAVKQLQSFGYGASDKNTEAQTGMTDLGTVPTPAGAIQKARDARSLLEEKSRQDSLYQ